MVNIFLIATLGEKSIPSKIPGFIAQDLPQVLESYLKPGSK